MLIESIKDPKNIFDWRYPLTFEQIFAFVCAYKAPIWIAGAIGLFRKHSWAWYVSVFYVIVTLAESLQFIECYIPRYFGRLDPHNISLICGIAGFSSILFNLPLLVLLILKRQQLLAIQHVRNEDNSTTDK